MNPQFKKGVLELIVLECVRRKDRYGCELVEEVSKVIDVNEGTIYPLLKRLTNGQNIGEVAARTKGFEVSMSPFKFLPSHKDVYKRQGPPRPVYF